MGIWGGLVLKKNIGIIIVALIIIAILVGLIIVISNNNREENNNEKVDIVDNQNADAPSKIYSNEKEISLKKTQELFEFIPIVYTEEMSPFTNQFILNAVMDKITNAEEEPDYSTENVDNMVTKIFGKDVKIDKEKVSTPDIAKSIYYFSKEADSYSVIPIGYEGVYRHQILKNATETEDAYYVYTYMLIGWYSYDEDSIVQDEFGDMDYENAKVQVIVGNKDGNDLVHVFDNYSKIYEDSIWVKNYSNVMPIYRYTLKKDGKNYYLKEVEQINY